MTFCRWIAVFVFGLLAVDQANAVSHGLPIPDPVATENHRARPILESQLQQKSSARSQKNAPAKKPAPAQPARPSSETTHAPRVETITYDAWIVTCRDSGGAASKRECVAALRITDANKRQTIVNWQIGYNLNGQFVTAMHVPPGLAITKENRAIGGGLLMADGVELKFGNGQPRRLNYVACTPQQCLAEAVIDDGFIKEAQANNVAHITFYTVTGGAIPLEVSIKGVAQAIPSARAK